MKFNWKFEPAVWKGIIAALVSAALIWGVDLTEWGDKLSQTADVIGVLIPLLAGLWIRQSVTPDAKVVERVTTNGEVVAGPANDVVTEGIVIRTTGDDFPLEGYEGRHLDV